MAIYIDGAAFGTAASLSHALQWKTLIGCASTSWTLCHSMRRWQHGHVGSRAVRLGTISHMGEYRAVGLVKTDQMGISLSRPHARDTERFCYYVDILPGQAQVIPPYLSQTLSLFYRCRSARQAECRLRISKELLRVFPHSNHMRALRASVCGLRHKYVIWSYGRKLVTG